MDEQETFVFRVVQLQSFTSMDPFLYDFLRETAFRFSTVVSYVKSIIFELYLSDIGFTYRVGCLSSIFETSGGKKGLLPSFLLRLVGYEEAVLMRFHKHHMSSVNVK